MLKNKIFIIIGIFLISSTFSCSTIGDKLLNPYASEFQCPLTDKGECIKLKEAYEKTLKDEPKVDNTPDKIEKSSNVLNSYNEEYLKKITKLLSEPETPMIVGPKVVRVLFFPYESEESILMMPRFAYFFLDEPKWIIGNYLMKGVK